jgi:hypothetical protein
VPQQRAAVESPVHEESVVLDRPAGAARLIVDPQRPDRDGGTGPSFVVHGRQLGCFGCVGVWKRRWR